MGMTNGEKIKVILKPRTDQIRIYDNWAEIEIQSLGINFSCEISWWNAEYKELTTNSETLVSLDVYNQVAWERDIAIQQLHELGYEFGEKIESTKNDLGVDCISREDAIQAMQDKAKKITNEDTINGLCGAVAILFDLPSVTPQEPQTFKWCTDCKEYDQGKHCCHRWSKVIRDTVEEMQQEPKTGHWIKSRDCYGNNHFTCPFCGHDIATKADIWNDNYCSNCGCRMIEPQESEDKE